MAEKEGFEPSRPFRSLHDFQSCALDQLGDFSIAAQVSYSLAVPSSDSFIIIPKEAAKSREFLYFFKFLKKRRSQSAAALFSPALSASLS